MTPQSRPYNSSATPRLNKRPTAVWAKAEGDLPLWAGAMLMAAVFAIITIWSAVA